MSSTGGGIVVHALNQAVWVSPDMTVTLTLRNETNTDTTITAEQCQTLSAGLDEGSYAFRWNGTNWLGPV